MWVWSLFKKKIRKNWYSGTKTNTRTIGCGCCGPFLLVSGRAPFSKKHANFLNIILQHKNQSATQTFYLKTKHFFKFLANAFFLYTTDMKSQPQLIKLTLLCNTVVEAGVLNGLRAEKRCCYDTCNATYNQRI
jgi:hypothetical protein